MVTYGKIIKRSVNIWTNTLMLMDADGLAEYLGVSRMTVYNMMKDGQIPKGNKLRGARRWNLDDVREFLKGGAK